jgi:hypothetical protein
MNNDNRRIGDHGGIVRAVLLFAVLLISFIGGRATSPGRVTIREAEATPVASELPYGIERFHDASNEVTCWTAHGYRENGLSCLPDQWLASARINDDGASQ